ncbi:MliC family protein [Sphingomonas sp. KR1UV-12]|uniref:MliC family protein n=1 Tax=Sphingomonas aurea TaxID=3063994 RepID=A0ABT9EN79_9SPHN|nr:MliC family protein [Sphingomonas sp. KR1UV-12]MDP1028282.1 MliC family protein [Sphingomonas sp. KR1UV-12]
MRAAAALGLGLLAGCSQPAALDRNAAAPSAMPTGTSSARTPAKPLDPTSPAAAGLVARRFLTSAVAGDKAAALREWRGDPASEQAALSAITTYGAAPVRVGRPGDEDAGMGQRYVTVPFRIGDTAGTLVIHRVAEGVESDDPHAHQWRVRSIDLPPSAAAGMARVVAAGQVPAETSATYQCDGGAVLTVRFDNRADTATLAMKGQSVTLAGQRAASGIWYAGAGYDLRGKGRNARLAAPNGLAKDCVAR